jgi:hypothetical protein
MPLQGKRKDHGRDHHVTARFSCLTRRVSSPNNMDTFNEIYASLSAVPGLCDSIGMEKGMQFIRLAARLKDKIITAQPPSHDAAEPPADIPDDIRTFLGAAVDLPMDYVDGCWKAFSDLVWSYDEDGKTKGADAEAFRKHGLDNLLGSLHFSQW